MRAARPRLPGWLLEAAGNGGPRGMVATPPRATGAGDRTRLIGLSDHFLPHPGRPCPGAALSRKDDQTAVDTALWLQTLSRLRRELAGKERA